MLLHKAETAFDGIARRMNNCKLAIDQDPSSIRVMQPEQYSHQGCLAGAIFAEKSVDFAGSEIE